jgi:hypothetical protein
MTTEATPEVPTTPAPGNSALKISLADIESEISHVAYMTGDRFLKHAEFRHSIDKGVHIKDAAVMTICVVVMKNGYLVVGTAAPASPENYDKAHGQKLAYDKCVAQIFPILGYQLKEQLHTSA